MHSSPFLEEKSQKLAKYFEELRFNREAYEIIRSFELCSREQQFENLLPESFRRWLLASSAIIYSSRKLSEVSEGPFLTNFKFIILVLVASFTSTHLMIKIASSTAIKLRAKRLLGGFAILFSIFELAFLLFLLFIANIEDSIELDWIQILVTIVSSILTISFVANLFKICDFFPRKHPHLLI